MCLIVSRCYKASFKIRWIYLQWKSLLELLSSNVQYPYCILYAEGVLMLCPVFYIIHLLCTVHLETTVYTYITEKQLTLSAESLVNTFTFKKCLPVQNVSSVVDWLDEYYNALKNASWLILSAI